MTEEGNERKWTVAFLFSNNLSIYLKVSLKHMARSIGRKKKKINSNINSDGKKKYKVVTNRHRLQSCSV